MHAEPRSPVDAELHNDENENENAPVTTEPLAFENGVEEQQQEAPSPSPSICNGCRYS